MQKRLYLLLCFCLIFTLIACNSKSNELNLKSGFPGKSAESTNMSVPAKNAKTETRDNDKGEDGMVSINITVGGTTFKASLRDNVTTQALMAQFPLTLQMNELNGQEKFCNLSDNLPAESTERPATIHAGDIKCWSGNSLVLFYKTYSNSYSGYVSLGKVDDPSKLASALGSGNVQVTWSLAN